MIEMLAVSKNTFSNREIFILRDEKISSAEAIDWITKYFILHSVVFCFIFLKVFIKAQKERVLSSSMIQTPIQEFIIKHIPVDRKMLIAIKRFTRIPFNIKLQV
jgi:hypothetical protein